MTTASCATSSSPGSTPSTRKIWIDGDLVDAAHAVVSVFDHGFLYGDGCFEGIRAYGGRIFKLRSHMERLYGSAKALRIEPPYPLEELEAAVRATVKANGLTDAYIRLVLSRGVGTLGLNPFKCPKPCAVIIADAIELYPPELYEKGLRVVVAERRRVPIPCLDPAIKSLNYLNNILAKVEAIDAGTLEAIMLNTEGYVSECTGDNLFVVNGNTVATPPTEAGILHGITRAYVLEELAGACGFEVEERMMRLQDVLSSDEVFLTGTAAEIIGVTQIGDEPISGGKVGPMTRRLTEAFRQHVNANASED